MSQDYKLFLCNQYASYAVQKILQVDCETVGYLEAFSKHNFYDLVLNLWYIDAYIRLGLICQRSASNTRRDVYQFQIVCSTEVQS